MTIGTFFTLFVIPSIYILVARDHTRDRVSEPVEISQ
jgi:multidrug efflux pump